MLDILGMFFSKTWEFFQIKWPGFEFTIGDVFLASAVTVGALTAILKMVGVDMPSMGAFVQKNISLVTRGDNAHSGGNNRVIKISPNRKGDTK